MFLIRIFDDRSVARKYMWTYSHTRPDIVIPRGITSIKIYALMQ